MSTYFLGDTKQMVILTDIQLYSVFNSEFEFVSYGLNFKKHVETTYATSCHIAYNMYIFFSH